MQAGRLDRQLVLKRRSLGAQDVNGSRPGNAWTEYATVWARKIDVSGREFYAAQTKQAEQTTRFEIRYRNDVSATDRVVCEGVDYELVQPPSEIGRRVGLTLFARAIIDG